MPAIATNLRKGYAGLPQGEKSMTGYVNDLGIGNYTVGFRVSAARQRNEGLLVADGDLYISIHT